MSESAEYTYPQRCERCGSFDISVKVYFSSGLVGYVCNECRYTRQLPKTSNLQKRTNASLANWAKACLKRQPYCRICGCSDLSLLQAHHIIPVSHSLKFKYDPRNGMTLCKRCHYLVHYKEKDEPLPEVENE